MKSKLDKYSLDDAGVAVMNLLPYENDVHLLVFCKAVIKYMRLSLRKKHGIELYNLQDEIEWIKFCRSILKKHHGLNNDMALIVVAHEIDLRVNELGASKTNSINQPKHL